MRRCLLWSAALLLSACPKSAPSVPVDAGRAASSDADAGAWADATLPEGGGGSDDFHFPHELVKWDFAKVEEVARDESGHGHHARVPVTGFTRATIFGKKWDGTQAPVLLKDHADFAPQAPFHLGARIMFDETWAAGTAHIVRRVGDAGRVAWALDLTSDGILRFTIGDADGKTASVEGQLKRSTSGESITANFDPETGELSLYAQCRELGKVTTPVRPAAALPGAHLELLTGMRGWVFELALQYGLMLPDGPLDGQCRFSGSKMETPEQRAAVPKPRPVGEERVAPLKGDGILRAAPGDFAVFDLHEWDSGFGADKRFEARGQLTLRRVEGDAPYVFELEFHLNGQWREAPRADSYAHLTALEPMSGTVLYAYPAETDFTEISFDPRYPPGAPERTKAGRKTFAGAAYDAEQVVDDEGRWKRLVADGAPALALSGGLLESARGTPKNGSGRGWLNRLAKTGKGSPVSAITTVWPPSRITTPYLVADDPMGDARRVARSKAEGLVSRAAYQLGEALDACTPIFHDERVIRDEILVALQAGKVLGVESKGAKPDAKTVSCLKDKAAGLALSPRISQLALQWAHEGPKPDWEVARERANQAIALVHVYSCATELGLVDGLIKKKDAAALVFEDGTLTAFTVGTASAPEALAACVKGKLDATPVVAEGRLDVAVPFTKK